jgi:hypothetical protein
MFSTNHYHLYPRRAYIQGGCLCLTKSYLKEPLIFELTLNFDVQVGMNTLQKRSLEIPVILTVSDYVFCDGTQRKEFFLYNSTLRGVSLTAIPNSDPAKDGTVVHSTILWESSGYTGELSVSRQLGVRGQCIPDPQTSTETFDGLVIESTKHFGYTNIINSADFKIQTHQFDCGVDEPCSDALVVFYKTDKFILSTFKNANKYRVHGRSIMEDGTDFTTEKEFTLDFMTITLNANEVHIRGVDEESYFETNIKLNSNQSAESPINIIEISSIVLSESFQKENISGLCGNFDKDASNDGAPSLIVSPTDNYFLICGAGAFIDPDDVSLVSFDTSVIDHHLCSITYQLNECPNLRSQSGATLMKR